VIDLSSLVEVAAKKGNARPAPQNQGLGVPGRTMPTKLSTVGVDSPKYTYESVGCEVFSM
jgi:hypothetical protein